MNHTIQTMAVSPTISIKEIDAIRRAYASVEPVKNVYASPYTYLKILDATVDMATIQTAYSETPIPTHAILNGVRIISDECVSDGFYLIMSAADFELYKVLKKHPYLTDDETIEKVFNLIKAGKIDNPLTGQELELKDK